VKTTRFFEPRLALFDFDGTLVHHCYEPFFGQLREFLTHHGYGSVTNEQLWEDHHHHRFLSYVPEAERAGLRRAFSLAMDESRLPTPVLFEQTQAALQALHDAGIKIAIVTARLALPKDLEPIIGELGLLDYISHVSTRGPAAPDWKDKCEQITQVCRHFAVQPEDAFMVGDMPVDITSARAVGAGSAVAVMTGGVSEQILKDCVPDHIVEHVGLVPGVVGIPLRTQR
jgi:phosphoglycolate phosphatase-like HAD superfamily hydrolase